MNFVIAAKGCRILLLNSFCFSRQEQFVYGFVHARFDELCYETDILRRRQYATIKFIHERRRLSSDIYVSIKYLVQHTFLSNVGEEDLDKPIGGGFQASSYFGLAGYGKVCDCVFHSLL